MKLIRSSTFVLDQAASSIITFLLFTAVAKSGGVLLVGTIAVLQSIVLIALTATRALSLDVWASRGGVAEERSNAISTALIAPIIIGALLGPIIWAMNSSEPTTLVYWIAAPAILILDIVRILLLHANKSWVSLICQLVTLTGLLVGSLLVISPQASMAIYAIGTIATCIAGFITLRLRPPVPSPRYAMKHRSRSIPFVIEVSLGSVVQQLLFILLAALSSIAIAGEIRIAQTLIGPMAVIHAGIAPQILRKLGQNQGLSAKDVAEKGIKYGWSLAGISFLGVLLMIVFLKIELSNRSVLSYFIGEENSHLSPIIAACGLALAFNGLILGTGAAARINGSTSRLNRARVFLIPVQVIIICVAAISNNPSVAAAGFALTAMITSIISIRVLRSQIKN